jgi:hypothetical protein
MANQFDWQLCTAGENVIYRGMETAAKLSPPACDMFCLPLRQAIYSNRNLTSERLSTKFVSESL